MACWITTHWPVCACDKDRLCHVYVRPNKKKVPISDDTVLIYVSETVTIRGKRITDAIRRYRGIVERVTLPKGAGRIICQVTVKGCRRKLTDDDVVYDFGDVREWQIIPCEDARPVRELSRQDMMEALGKRKSTSPRFLNLWCVPDEFVHGLMKKLGLQA